MRHRTSILVAVLILTFSLSLLHSLMRPAGAQRRPNPNEAKPSVTTMPTPIPTPQSPFDSCCGKKPPLKQIPNYSSSTYASFTGQIAVATNHGVNANDPSVVIWDLKNQATAPLGVQWGPSSVPPTNLYFHPDWTRQVIGDVFGVTLDNNGNIYVASTKVYGFDNLGSPLVQPGIPGAGDIYKLDANTGSATRFIQTLNAAVYSNGSPDMLPNAGPIGPGLGNIRHSCAYNSFYATDFEDGLIYHIDMNGHILNRFDHGQNLPTASPSRTAIPDTQTAGFTPLRRRVVAVQDRPHWPELFYSVWSRDSGRPSSSVANEIWKIRVDSAGNFIGSATLVITLPPYTTGGNFSDPVFDISFSASGNSIFLAERSMSSDMFPSAHESRGLAYDWNGTAWVPQPVTTFQIGSYLNKTNAAGGIALDNGPGGLAWFTADYVTPTFVYGLQGTPVSGGTYLNSIDIDLNNAPGTNNKRQIGDVEIPCLDFDVHLGSCCFEFNTKAVFTSFSLVNLSGVYKFTSKLSAGPGNITRVTATILNAYLTYPSSTCGTNGPVSTYITSAQPVGGFTPSVPVPNGNEVIWYGSGVPLNGVNFTFNVKFPPPPVGDCADYLSFCVKYTFTNASCRTCEVIKCYGPFRRIEPDQPPR
jgi:hypothetical protein